ncbi:LAMI_0H17304g1_1 [Lachancea mirantina]|uniref:LAMI_0H17304g1_1 n=1 Tax=Lachancea mirantina TaxID=1230905 RepID=A0A1G4KJ46_9SACH|nr:LAMI_0H17304g1_1 [Lachancea mirantina]
MCGLENAITEAKCLLAENNVQEALRRLKPFRKSLKAENSKNVALQQVFAEAYLEAGKVDKAYPLLTQACELDSDGRAGGSQKFFTLGQIMGGGQGIQLLMQGIESVSAIAGEMLQAEQADMIVRGLLSMIEIWMTDLCMEPNAEAQCEELISKAMEVSDDKSPEVWSMLGSIRISQQRFLEAASAFASSWKFFQEKKESIEANLHNGRGTFADFVELLQPLLSLAKMCIELGIYDLSLEILAAVRDIDEDNLEGYYLEGFSHYMICKRQQFAALNPGVVITAANAYEFNENLQQQQLSLDHEPTQSNIREARIALTMLEKLAENRNDIDDVIQELLSGARVILPEIGGRVDVRELNDIRKGEEVDDEEEVDLELKV